MAPSAILVLGNTWDASLEAAVRTSKTVVICTEASEYPSDICIVRRKKNPFFENELHHILVNRQITQLYLVCDSPEEAVFIATYAADYEIAVTFVSDSLVAGIETQSSSLVAQTLSESALSTPNSNWKESLNIATLAHCYAQGTVTPIDVIKHCYDVIYSDPQYKAVWITLFPLEDVLTYTKALMEKFPDPTKRPALFGIPFSIKDSYDVKGVLTTGACPAFAFTASQDATAVTMLKEAGAIPLGKVNLAGLVRASSMLLEAILTLITHVTRWLRGTGNLKQLDESATDQLATGLVGMRSPYGQPHSTFSSLHVSGGSSSGSCVSVSAGHVSFSLATDTAGSGRVPAAFNGIVGFKPTRGTIPTAGIIPCCLSLDCAAIEALSIDDVREVWNVLFKIETGPSEPFSKLSRPPWAVSPTKYAKTNFTFAFPSRSTDSRSDNYITAEFNDLFDKAIEKLVSIGGVPIETDYTLYENAGRLLYEGSFVSERVSGVKQWWDEHPKPSDGSDDVLLPEIRSIYTSAEENFNATRAYQDILDQMTYQRRIIDEFKRYDVLVVPTAPLHPTKEQYNKDPIGLNHKLGKFTHYANVLDMTGTAIPAGFTQNNMPFGITILGPSFSDGLVLEIAERFERYK